MARFRELFLVMLLAFSPLVGCNRSRVDSDGGSNEPQITICLLPKIKGISYFSSCYVGAREAAEELGDVNLIYDGPIDGDPKKQAEMIVQWMVDGVDVICVSPMRSPKRPRSTQNSARHSRNRSSCRIFFFPRAGHCRGSTGTRKPRLCSRS